MALGSRASQTHAARTRRRVLQEMPGGHVWRDHAPNHTGIRWDEVLIAAQYRGIMFQGDEPEYPPTQVEILSEGYRKNKATFHASPLQRLPVSRPWSPGSSP
jgi:hypothetical protein